FFPTEYGLDLLADFVDLRAKIVQNLGGNAFTFTEQTQELVLCADIAVVRSFCFFLSERQNFLGPLSESLKRIQGPYSSWTPFYCLVGASTSSTFASVPVGTSAPNITSNSGSRFRLRTVL